MALNVHRVFDNSTNSGSYHAALAVTELQEQALRSARDKIREQIRSGLRSWETLVERAAMFDHLAEGVAPPALRPKFRMQGSFSYRTQVEPAHLPPQEIDLDDGMFLPTSFVSQNGSAHPIVASRGLFRAVEQALATLCRREGWRLVTDKPSCVRVEISENAHVDIALYAIPDAQFAQLVESAVLKVAAADSQFRNRLHEAVEFNDEIYRGLRDDALMLAHRLEGWKPSDPRKLDDWFQGAIARHGQQVRRVSKYLKGWRDFKWVQSCRLSSIALMAATVSSYDRASNDFDESRDDLALLRVAQQLPTILANRISNPVVPGQYLDEGWSVEQRNEYVAHASALANQVHTAINRSNTPAEAIRNLTTAFGTRIPKTEELVQFDGRYESLASPTVHRPAVDRDQAAAAAISEVRESGQANKPWKS